MEASITNYQL